MTRWVPRFVWDDGVDIFDETLQLPVGLWRHGGPPVAGGDIESDAGIPASFVVRRTRTLTIPIRFYESEWPIVRRLLQFAQGDGSFAWHIDADDDRVYDLVLESPEVGEDIAPEPDAEYPRAMTITVVVRNSDDSPFDGLEYFGEPVDILGVEDIPNRELWLDASDDSTVDVSTVNDPAVEGDYPGVSEWRDRTGNGRAVVQALEPHRPSRDVNINGRQAIRFISPFVPEGFDFTANFMTTAWPDEAELGGGSTVFAVCRTIFYPGILFYDIRNFPLVRWYPSNANGIEREPTDDPIPESQLKFESFVGTAGGLIRATPSFIENNNTLLVVSRVSPEEITFYRNRVVVGGPTPITTAIHSSVGDTFAIARADVEGALAFGFYDIGELLVFSRALTAEEMDLVQDYLEAKWGL